jgi:hypothetical protein
LIAVSSAAIAATISNPVAAAKTAFAFGGMAANATMQGINTALQLSTTAIGAIVTLSGAVVGSNKRRQRIMFRVLIFFFFLLIIIENSCFLKMDESHHHPVEFVDPWLSDPFILAIVGQIQEKQY